MCLHLGLLYLLSLHLISSPSPLSFGCVGVYSGGCSCQSGEVGHGGSSWLSILAARVGGGEVVAFPSVKIKIKTPAAFATRKRDGWSLVIS